MKGEMNVRATYLSEQQCYLIGLNGIVVLLSSLHDFDLLQSTVTGSLEHVFFSSSFLILLLASSFPPPLIASPLCHYETV